MSPHLRHVPASLARRVRERANHCCEYCGIAQTAQEATFHVDHVLPRASAGPTTYENLALACVSCSLRKGARVDARDPETDQLVALYSPRSGAWSEHFELTSMCLIVGLTPTGRATAEALQFNRLLGVAIRREERARGRLGLGK